MRKTTPLSLRIEARSLDDLRNITQEVGRHGRYAADAQDGPPPRINPTQTVGNRILHGSPASEVAHRVEAAIETIGLARRTGKASQAVAAEIVMTVDAAWARDRGEAWREDFLRRATAFLIERYGEDRVLSVTAHIDEAAPHLHAFVLPVTEISRGNRYGKALKTLQAISYTKVFGSPNGPDEYAARWDRSRSTSETTETGRLQTAAAAALADLGIVRGAVDSARHRKHIKRDAWYGLLQHIQADFRQDLEKLAPPPPDLMAASYPTPAEAVVAGWAAGYAAAVHAAITHPVVEDAATARLERARRQDADNAAAEAAKEAEEAMQEIKMLQQQARTVPAAALSPWLGDDFPLSVVCDGRRRRIENALDRLMYIGDETGRRLSGTKAAVWVAERLGYHDDAVETICETAAQTAATNARDGVRITLTARQERLRASLVRQARDVYAALGVERLRVSVIDPATGRAEKVTAKGVHDRDQIGAAMTIDEYAEIVDVLMAKNAAGFGVYFTPEPMDKTAADILLIDDIERPETQTKDGRTLAARTAADVAAFIEASNPNVYMRTSSHKTQALYVLPKAAGVGNADHDLRNMLMRRLNAQYGDAEVGKSGAIVHAFRAPGFRNPKYATGEPVYVELLRPCHAGASRWAFAEYTTMLADSRYIAAHKRRRPTRGQMAAAEVLAACAPGLADLDDAMPPVPK